MTEKVFKINRNVVLLIVLLMATTSIISILDPSLAYSGETRRNQLLMLSWDWSLLLTVVPALLIVLGLMNRYKCAVLFLSGILFYLMYNYMLYGFSLRFNALLLNYTVLLGLSTYLFFYNVFHHNRMAILGEIQLMRKPMVLVGYLFFMGCLFGTIWCMDLIPSLISGKIPSYCIELGYITSYVHLIDIALVLPLFFISGYLLIKKSSMGEFLGIVSVVFILVLSISMIASVVFEYKNGFDADFLMILIFSILLIVGICVLNVYLKRSNQIDFHKM